MASVSLFLDQVGVQTGLEMDRIAKSISISPSSSSSSIFYEKNSNCPSYCWAASYNRHNEIDYLIDSLFLKLEELDNVRSINIVADGCQGLGSGLSSGLLQELRDLMPSLNLRSAFVLPLGPSAQGMGAINLTLAAQSALEFSDCLTLRSLNDAMLLTTTEGGSAANTTCLKDVHSVLAGDLLVGWGPRSAMGQADIWPLSACSSTSRCKLIDIRTSFWRAKSLMQSESKKKTRSEYSPLRALSANMHALHLSVFEDQTFSIPIISGTTHSATSPLLVAGASMRIVTVDHRLGLSLHEPLWSRAETTAALQWACPHTQWPSLLGKQHVRDNRSGLYRDGEKERAGGDQNSEMGFTVKSAPQPLATQVPSVAGAGSATPGISIAAMAFTSPYAVKQLVDAVKRTDHLLKRRAFVHNYDEFGFVAAELHSAVDALLVDLS